MSSVNLCALHCELRNTEQLLRTLGLFVYQVGSLPECNDELSQYGPENFNSHISVKLKEGQETAVEKHNIKVASFSGKYNVYHKLRIQPLNVTWIKRIFGLKKQLRIRKVTFWNIR